MKKVLLLRPSSHLLKAVPIGLLTLASYVKKKLGSNVDVKINDYRLKDFFDENEVEKLINSFQPDIIGITSLSPEVDKTLELARYIKKISNSMLILGGPLATSEHDIISELNIFDYIVVGEGEEALIAIVEGNFPKEKKVLFAKDFNAVDIDYVEFPDYSLIDLEVYFNYENHETFQIHKNAAPIFTSRGCPFDCAFCLHMFGKKVRFRKIENVISEIEYLVTKYNVRELHIEDDIFNIKKERVIKFFELLNRKNITLSISFPNGLKFDFLDEEVVRLFKKNGVYRVCLGIESVSEKIMNLVSKKHNMKKLQEAISLLNKYNILAHGFFINGLPSEDVDDINTTFNFINNSKLHSYSISRYVPFRNTALYEKLFSKTDNDFKRIERSEYHATNLNYSDIPLETIEKLQKKNIYKFYFNPIRVYSIFLAINKMVLAKSIYKMVYYFFTGKIYYKHEKKNKPSTYTV